MSVHRLVMTRLLGRRLERDEHVHHVDGNRHNNHPSNLKLLRAGAHTVEGHWRHPLVKWCAWSTHPPRPLPF